MARAAPITRHSRPFLKPVFKGGDLPDTLMTVALERSMKRREEEENEPLFVVRFLWIILVQRSRPSQRLPA